MIAITSYASSGRRECLKIIITVAFIVCGDGIVEGAETCDDHNMIGGDGCSEHCQIEAPQPSLYSYEHLVVEVKPMRQICRMEPISGHVGYEDTPYHMQRIPPDIP